MSTSLGRGMGQPTTFPSLPKGQLYPFPQAIRSAFPPWASNLLTSAGSVPAPPAAALAPSRSVAFAQPAEASAPRSQPQLRGVLSPPTLGQRLDGPTRFSPALPQRGWRNHFPFRFLGPPAALTNQKTQNGTIPTTSGSCRVPN